MTLLAVCRTTVCNHGGPALEEEMRSFPLVHRGSQCTSPPGVSTQVVRDHLAYHRWRPGELCVISRWCTPSACGPGSPELSKSDSDMACRLSTFTNPFPGACPWRELVVQLCLPGCDGQEGTKENMRAGAPDKKMSDWKFVATNKSRFRFAEN